MKEYFPDGTPIDEWFYETKIPELNLKNQYVLTDYGIFPDEKLHTSQIQNLIDTCSSNGGGTIVVPEGTFLTGSLFFRQNVNLYLPEGAVLKGSDDISDYPVLTTRIEGETCRYFAALINADGLDGFTIHGKGTIDGNGLKSWKAFWLRREWNPDCTNKDEQRPRLIYIANCSNVTVCGLRLQNSHFWTNHIYKSHHVKFLGCSIYSPARPVKAPSTDAIDLDVCHDVLIKNCRMEVNDDAVAIKGGKGPDADKAPENGSVERVLIEDCEYGFCHGCLTVGSECVHCRNIILRRITVSSGFNLLWLKMRPDTPQHYEYITVQDISGRITNFLNINPWTQFFDMKGKKELPESYSDHITLRNCQAECETFFNVVPNPPMNQYRLSDFLLENLKVKADDISFSPDGIKNLTVMDVKLEKTASYSKNNAPAAIL